MKLKKIMIITLLLLAVFSIAAVSASDEVASDGLNATDDAVMEMGSDFDRDYHSIEVNDEEIDIEDKTEEIAYITLPDSTKKGSFQILKGNDVLASLDVKDMEEDEGDLDGTIYLKNFNLTKVSNGDTLYFKFIEGNGEAYEPLTVVCKVSLTGSTLKLTEIDGDLDNDVEIQVNNVNTDEPDANFTYINVTEKDGFFIISVEGDEEDYIIFSENLKTTNRAYVNIGGKYGFAFSLTDVNNYISANINGASTFNEFINKYDIDSESEIYFGVYEDDEGYDEIDSETMTFRIKDKQIIFVGEGAFDVDYVNLETVMSEGWQETEVIEYTVKKGMGGTIVICLNDDTTPVFNKKLSELTPEDIDDDELDYYSITIGDLNITRAGKYVIKDVFSDDNGVIIYQYDDDFPEVLEILEAQCAAVNNVTVDVRPFSTPIRGNIPLITISDASSDENKEVQIYIDGNETPVNIKIDELDDGEGNYTILPKQLPIGIGEHKLKVAYKDINLNATVYLTIDLLIEFPDEIVYTTFNESFVFISLDDEDENILEADINGALNLTILDAEGNPVYTYQYDTIHEINNYDENQQAYIIRTNDIDATLSGKYTVLVRYTDEYGGEFTEKANVTFKEFEAGDYGTSFNDNLNDEDAYAFTFTNVSSNLKVIVEIDGNKSAEIDGSDLGFDNEKGVYYLKSGKLTGLTDGSHLITVSVSSGKETIKLASSNIIVDLEENFNLNLTVNVADIEEGNAANVVITTNSTFTGNGTVQVADKNYTVKVEKGKGTILISGLSAGTYTATAFFKSNGIFNDAVKSTTFKVTVKPAAPAKKEAVIKLTLKNVKVKKSAKKLVLSATLKINGKAAKKGTKLVFKFKNKKFKAKVGKKGVAKYTIKAKMLKKLLKKVKVGKKVKYQVTYGGKTVSRTVKVKK